MSHPDKTSISAFFHVFMFCVYSVMILLVHTCRFVAFKWASAGSLILIGQASKVCAHLPLNVTRNICEAEINVCDRAKYLFLNTKPPFHPVQSVHLSYNPYAHYKPSRHQYQPALLSKTIVAWPLSPQFGCME